MAYVRMILIVEVLASHVHPVQTESRIRVKKGSIVEVPQPCSTITTTASSTTLPLTSTTVEIIITTSTTTTLTTINASKISTSTISIPEGGISSELIYSSILIILSIV